MISVPVSYLPYSSLYFWKRADTLWWFCHQNSCWPSHVYPKVNETAGNSWTSCLFSKHHSHFRGEGLTVRRASAQCIVPDSRQMKSDTGRHRETPAGGEERLHILAQNQLNILCQHAFSFGNLPLFHLRFCVTNSLPLWKTLFVWEEALDVVALTSLSTPVSSVYTVTL